MRPCASACATRKRRRAFASSRLAAITDSAADGRFEELEGIDRRELFHGRGTLRLGLRIRFTYREVL